MYRFLAKVELEALKLEIAGKLSKDWELKLEKVDRNTIYSILFGLYGYDLLYEKEFRFLLLNTLSDEKLAILSNAFGITKVEKKYDVCLSLVNIPWRVGSKIAWWFSELFSISLEFLPSKSTRNPAIESVEPYSPPPPLFDFQKDIVDKVISILSEANKKAFLVQLPTGAGKTRTLLEAIVQYCNMSEGFKASNNILWLAHSQELCEQAIETFREVWQAEGEEDIQIIRYWGDYKPVVSDMSGAFIVSSFQKLFNLYKKSLADFEIFKRRTKILVIDEAHKSLADTHQILIEEVYRKSRIFLIGLTATPGRGKESLRENIELSSLYEKNLVTSDILEDDPVKTLQDRGILSKIRYFSYDFKDSVSLTGYEKSLVEMFNDIPPTVLKRLGADKKRNDLIISILKNEITKGNKSLVFTCSVEHARKLAVLGGMSNIKSSYIHCNMRRGLRRRIIAEFRNNSLDVIYNYGVLSTGFDAPNIRTILISRPTSSVVLYSQMIGRGLRGMLVGGTEECNLIDIRDNFINFGGVNDVYQCFQDFWKLK